MLFLGQHEHFKYNAGVVDGTNLIDESNRTAQLHTVANVEYLLHDVSAQIAAIGPASPSEMHTRTQAEKGERVKHPGQAHIPMNAGNPRAVPPVPPTHPRPAIAPVDFPDGIGTWTISRHIIASPFSLFSYECTAVNVFILADFLFNNVTFPAWHGRNPCCPCNSYRFFMDQLQVTCKK